VSDVTDLRTELGAAPVQRDVLRVHGPEAVEYLQGQLSQDVAALEVGRSAATLLLQPTGKVDAWLRATRLEDDAVALDVDAGAGEAVAGRLRRFKLRTRADFDSTTWVGWAVRGAGAAAVAASDAGVRALPAPWPGVEAVDLLGEHDAPAPDLPIVDADALEVVRLEAGVPAMGAEVTPETIPAELGQWLIDASVSFTKGCYTGQELVARIDSRGGNVPRPLRGLLVEGAAPSVGADVVAAGKVVGQVSSSATSPALGPIALAPVARGLEPGSEVVVAGTVARVAELPLR
jgi:folate-binding protein YgfZ